MKFENRWFKAASASPHLAIISGPQMDLGPE